MNWVFYVQCQPRDTKAGDTPNLIKAARQLFYQRGYEGASTKSICALADVTRGALYHNFDGKRGLLEAVIHQIDDEVTTLLGYESALHADRIHGFEQTCIMYLASALHPEFRKLVLLEGPAVLGYRVDHQGRSARLGPLMDAITALQDADMMVAGDPQVLAVAVHGAVVDIALWIAAVDGDKQRMALGVQTLRTLIHRFVVAP